MSKFQKEYTPRPKSRGGNYPPGPKARGGNYPPWKKITPPGGGVLNIWYGCSSLYTRIESNSVIDLVKTGLTEKLLTVCCLLRFRSYFQIWLLHIWARSTGKTSDFSSLFWLLVLILLLVPKWPLCWFGIDYFQKNRNVGIHSKCAPGTGNHLNRRSEKSYELISCFQRVPPAQR